MPKPSVLVIHNRYRQPGGEDSVVSAEIELLRQNGHRVLQYARHNREISDFGPLRKACLGVSASWDHESYKQVRRFIRQERPQIAHCHNVVPLISPAVYYACAAEGVPVVQTIHNYRLLCPKGDLFHAGAVCEGCGCGLTRAVRRGCYRDSRIQSAAVSMMMTAHHSLGTWRERIHTYIAPSEFCRHLLCRGGIPSEKVVVKPHFATEGRSPIAGPGRYAVFVGRLSEEKGILQLLRLWSRHPGIPLMVIGSGPLEMEAKRLAENLPQVEFAGQLSHAETLDRIREARFLIAPSLCYETFGVAVLEAASCGVPAIASRHGALRELVGEQGTGLLFDPSDADEAADVINWAWSHPLRMREMGRAARANALQHYSPGANYGRLMAIYEKGISAGVTVASVSGWHLFRPRPPQLSPETQN